MNPVPLLVAVSTAVALLLAGGVPANAGSVVLSPGALGQVAVPVRSFQEIRFEDVIRQAYDFSCGSAALATLLTYHYQKPHTEEIVFTSMYERGDQEKIRSKGFSLLDMKLYLESLGYRADGFKISLDKLIEVDIAAIALINVKGYSHFVVIKAADAGRVLISDPALGNRVVDRQEFETMWNGIFLVIHSETNVAHASFNAPDAWKGHPPPPFSDALSRRSLAELSMSISQLGDY